jgi:hypothetical protein
MKFVQKERNLIHIREDAIRIVKMAFLEIANFNVEKLKKEVSREP